MIYLSGHDTETRRCGPGGTQRAAERLEIFDSMPHAISSM